MANFLLVGCGAIATALGQQLAAEGHRCIGLRRQPQSLPDGIEPLQADVTRPQTLESLPEQLDYVLYTLIPASHDEAGYRRSYIDGLRNLIQALHHQRQSLQRLLFVSSTAVYHQSHGEWIDEYSDTNPQNYNGQVMLEAERLAQQSGFPTTRIRFSGIYGGGEERLLHWAKEGVRCPDYPPHYSNRIHQGDCVGVLKHLIDMNLALQFPEDLYLASDGQPASYGEILQWLRHRLGLPERAEGPALEARIRAGSKRCSNQRLLTSGYQFRYPDFRSGYEAILKGRSPG